jgi:hypothetical protein
VEEDPGADPVHDGQTKLREMQTGEWGTGGGQTKCKNGQIQTVGDSYAEVEIQGWK